MKNAMLLSILQLFLLQLNAQNHQTNTRKMILEYADGNGNYYKISADSIIYKPITKEMSSSGMYDGGEPAEKSITEKEFVAVKEEFDAIFNKTEIHIQFRMKTSGMMIIKKGEMDEKKVIIKRSPEQEKLETLLNTILTD